MENIITRVKFEEAFKKFPPDKIELFFLRYFSAHSLRSNKWLIITLSVLIIFPILFEIIVYNFPIYFKLKLFTSIIYMWILILFSIYWLLVVVKKNKRYKKIRKYLNINKNEFKELIEMHCHNKYASTRKFIEFNSK